ncbi:hypothetical protein Ahy_A09g043641 isoform B [Arachis hypogaea]|uniref:At2g35280-like TPR domain-containing protein n=1 Tax=Arachis hypogaea TaxID=3818 RepID=A0A445BIU5_ARAHY|nr:hypothetical protein Ahy_A09g043641 isoform B [Arachis hypogaea]
MDIHKDKIRQFSLRKLDSKGRSGTINMITHKVTIERFSTAVDLPLDVWLAIAIKFASNSIEDLCRFRMTYCAMRDADKEDTVLKMVFISPAHAMKWWWRHDPIERRFFERCFEIGHPELLFREVLRKLYIRRNHAVRWEMLQNSASNGIDAAKYSVSMELLCRRDDNEAKKWVETISRARSGWFTPRMLLELLCDSHNFLAG